MARGKLTKLEKYWILYDVANSAFILLVTTIVPIYFNSLAEAAGISEVDYLAYWGYAASVATLVVALIGPVFGTMADMKNYKKPIFTISMMVGVLGCAALSFPTSWVIFLAVFVIAKVGFSTSLIFYDSMLSDVTEPERMDEVSSQGYAWGVHRKLCAVYCQPWNRSWKRGAGNLHDGGNGNLLFPQCGLVAGFNVAFAAAL